MILETMKSDRISAMRSRDSVASNVLATVISACDTVAKQGTTPITLTDSKVVEIIRGIIKRINETLDILKTRSDRADDLAKYTRESEILSVYLPKQLSDDQIKEIVLSKPDLNLGQIMAYLKANYAGQYDAKRATEIIKENK